MQSSVFNVWIRVHKLILRVSVTVSIGDLWTSFYHVLIVGDEIVGHMMIGMILLQSKVLIEILILIKDFIIWAVTSKQIIHLMTLSRTVRNHGALFL